MNTPKKRFNSSAYQTAEKNDTMFFKTLIGASQKVYDPSDLHEYLRNKQKKQKQTSQYVSPSNDFKKLFYNRHMYALTKTNLQDQTIKWSEKINQETSFEADDDYTCPVCMLVCVEPVTKKCGHYICFQCERKLIEDSTSKNTCFCPVCKSPFKGSFQPKIDRQL